MAKVAELKMEIDLDKIARVVHEANRAWCAATGNHSQPEWDKAALLQRETTIKGVQCALLGPSVKELHDSWMAEKAATGWKHGPVKDADKKEHPALVPWSQLPPEERMKDYLFLAIVDAFRKAK